MRITKSKYKETAQMRKDRIALSGAVRQRVVPGKKSYKRKEKHSKQETN